MKKATQEDLVKLQKIVKKLEYEYTNPVIGEIYLFVTLSTLPPKYNVYSKAIPGSSHNFWIKFRATDITQAHEEFSKIHGVWVNAEESGFIYSDIHKNQRKPIEDKYKGGKK